jgi:hypothetical protein
MLQEEFENACNDGDVQKVRRLLKSPSVDPRLNEANPMVYAASCGWWELVRELILDGRTDPTAGNNAVIKIASGRGNFPTVQLLLNDSRIDPSASKNGATSYAILNGNPETLRVLLTDYRVCPLGYFARANYWCQRILAADPRWGIHVYPALYAKHHPKLVAEYERVRGQARAIVWLMRHDNLGAWEGVAEPLVERLKSFLLY